MDGKEKSIAHTYQKLYGLLTDVLAQSFDVDNADKDLATIELLATFNWNIHSGHFVDARLDRWAVAIGQKLAMTTKTAPPPARSPGHTGRRHVLHVVSETYEVGGHTRLLLNIIKTDLASIHDLVLTRQHTADVPVWLLAAVSSSGGRAISLVERSRSGKVVELQSLFQANDTRILYHIHPNDAEAIAAVGLAGRPKIVFINHADHLFWLGGSVVDVVVCIRAWSIKLSETRRMAHRAMLLPIPMTLNTNRQFGKAAARQKLGIAAEEVIILTVASAYKFIPSGKYNYFRTVGKILAASPSAKLKIIGISQHDDLGKGKVGFVPNDRIELLGLIADPQLYYEAADIYLDCMPLSSFTSLYEAVFYRCFPVLQFDPTSNLVLAQEPVFKGLFVHPGTEQEFIEVVCKAISNKQWRETTSDLASQRVESTHMGEVWMRYLTSLYAVLDGAGAEQERPIYRNEDDSVEKAGLTQDDIDAAEMSYSFQGNDAFYLSRLFSRYLACISYAQFIRIYWCIRMNLPRSNELFSLRRLAGLLKAKSQG